jgi:hypothetical protein
MAPGPRKARPDDRLRIKPGIQGFPDTQCASGMVLTHYPGVWIASLVRNDVPEPSAQLFSPDITGPNSSQLSPLKRIICNCSSGAKSVGLVLIFVPGK